MGDGNSGSLRQHPSVDNSFVIRPAIYSPVGDRFHSYDLLALPIQVIGGACRGMLVGREEWSDEHAATHDKSKTYQTGSLRDIA